MIAEILKQTPNFQLPHADLNASSFRPLRVPLMRVTPQKSLKCSDCSNLTQQIGCCISVDGIIPWNGCHNWQLIVSYDIATILLRTCQTCWIIPWWSLSLKSIFIISFTEPSAISADGLCFTWRTIPGYLAQKNPAPYLLRYLNRKWEIAFVELVEKSDYIPLLLEVIIQTHPTEHVNTAARPRMQDTTAVRVP